MNEFIIKYSKAGIWISLIGSVLCLIPLFYVLNIQLKAFLSKTMLMVWQKPDWSYVYIISIGLFLWLIFPTIYFISIRGCQDCEQTQVINLLSGIANITLIIIPIILIILTKFTK